MLYILYHYVTLHRDLFLRQYYIYSTFVIMCDSIVTILTLKMYGFTYTVINASNGALQQKHEAEIGT